MFLIRHLMMPHSPARILLIDDHRLFNDLLKSMLNQQPDITVCGQVFQAPDVLPAIHHTSPDIALLDANLQGVSGLDIGKRIRGDFPAVRVLILTMYNQPKLLDEARRVGLHGYMLKDATTDTLLHGIHTVLNGDTYFDPAIALPSAPTNDPFGDDFARRLNLTFREVEIIALIREGLTNEQIAGRIYLSVETVKTHRKNIHTKLGISKAADLVRFAIENGI